MQRIWDSPTLMTWLSYSTKALALFGVLPLVLNRFSSGDIVLWYLFSTIISLQSIADFGFRQTFSRIISYAYGGAKEIYDIIIRGEKKEVLSAPNEALLNRIVFIQKYIYIRLTLVLFGLFAVFGTWSLVKPIESASNEQSAWICWVLVLVISCISFYGKIYLNFLEGLNKIAMVRRVETLTSVGSLLSCIAVLIVSSSLLNLIIANQFWVLIVTFRDWYLCRQTEDGLFKRVDVKATFDPLLLKKIWNPAWRSGISGLMSTGLTNLTALVYAQIGNTEAVAAYLLALKIINQIRDVSMAPFYSKIPKMSILRIRGEIQSLVAIIKRGMFLSHLVFVLGFVVVGASSDFLLKLIGSEVKFVDQSLWILLGVAFFIHRFGAMHIQVYMTTNHIISHIADGITGALYILISLILSPYIGIYAVPVGMLISYLGFYAWYAAKYSYESMQVDFWKFEKSTSLLAVIILIVYIVISFQF